MSTAPSAERLDRLRTLLSDALELQPADRAAFIDAACADDAELRPELESLLVAHDAIGSFDAVAGALSTITRHTGDAELGRRLGAFRIVRVLGYGGMGAVYLGERVDGQFEQRVALKIIRSGRGGEEARRRFLEERQILARLEHAHIARLLDGGITEEGEPYFAMEYIEGEPIDDYCDSRRLNVDQRLQLFLQVCDAVQHAHQGLVVHRDLKPSNILVTVSGQVKLLDFGIAKLLPQDTNGTAEVTHTRLRWLTPEYAAPEQVRGEPVTTAADVYALGVVLYEQLAGRSPYRLESASPTEVERMICETEPERPSVVASRPDAEPPTADQASKARNTQPAQLRRRLEGDLDNIVLQALRKEPTRRYASAAELGQDIERHFAGLPVRARPATVRYRVAKFVRRHRAMVTAAAIMALLSAGTIALIAAGLTRDRTRTPGPRADEYVQLTNFAESVTSPSLSPDGRMVTFIRGESTFFGPGQVYNKLLPDGEPVQLTHDSTFKMAPKFSPDGARVTYTTIGASGWDTWVVPVNRAQPSKLFLSNAAALTWIDARPGQPRFLYSETTGRDGQMAIATSAENRAQHRTIYLPSETGMAHRSYLSPDRKHVLLVEMDYFNWLPCRLTPFDGSAPGNPVGPAPAQCTDAAWSPDGKWMYFSANTGNGFHIWRQRFPNGKPEQVTFGLTHEEGVELATDGRSLITSIGTRQSTIWVHDSRGDRQITSQGFGIRPSFSPDGRKLYYLLRVDGPESFVNGTLWVADLESGQHRRLLQDHLVQNYSISADGQRVVFVAADERENSPVLLASLDGRVRPRQLARNGLHAGFGANGQVIFAAQENGNNFMYRLKEDGSAMQRIAGVSNLLSISPDGKWAAARLMPTKEMANLVGVYPIDGGPSTLVCGTCAQPSSFERGPFPPDVSWSPDGKFLYLVLRRSVYAIPLQPGQVLPAIGAAGLQTEQDVAALPGAQRIAEVGAFPGPNPSVYAYTKVPIQRNIYRVPVR